VSGIPEFDTIARTPRLSRAATSVYEAGSQTRRTLGWHAPTVSPNTAVLFNLSRLRDRARTATRNDGYAKNAIDVLVAELIGTGVKPQSLITDPDLRKAIQQLWLEWTDESDADGVLDWYGQQSQAVRAWLEGGEVFVRLRPRRLSDGLSVPLQVQVIEPELCPYMYSGLSPSGNRIRAGIEFDAIGRRVAYWFHPSRPGDFQDYDPTQYIAVKADSVIHLYDPLRPGQLRGVPHLTQALIRLHELDKFDDATLLRQQLANLFAMFVTRPATMESEATHPLTGLPLGTSPEGDPMITLQPGIVQELNPGEEVEFSKPPDAGQGYRDFTKQQLQHVAASTGVPYELLTGDMSGLNDRVVRVILQRFRRRLQAWQHQIIAYQLCRRVWYAWFEQAVLSGALPVSLAAFIADPDLFAAAKWMPQGWPYLHPVQDIEASVKAIRAGLSTRSAEVSGQGDDAEQIDREQADDNARADGLKLQYDSDGRAPTGGGTPANASGDHGPVD
jgi:lambda family phage portal protein